MRESCPGHEVGSDDKRESTPDPSMDDTSAWKRIFMGLLALALDVASVPVISLGFWYGSWALVMFIVLGAGLLYVSWFAWLAAFPKFRSQVRKRWNWEAKQQKRDEKRQARENEATWLKNLPLVVLVATAVLFSCRYFGRFHCGSWAARSFILINGPHRGGGRSAFAQRGIQMAEKQ